MLTQKREVVVGALFDLLRRVEFSQPVCGQITFVTASRRLVHWSKVSRSDRPSLYLATQNEIPVYRKENVPDYHQIRYRAFIYTDATGSTGIPDTDQSVILEAIEKVLDPGFRDKLTLGGLVSHCRIDGEIIRDAGDLDGDGIIVIPIMTTLT